MKKFISMVMAAAMVVSLVPATAFAADGDISASAKIIDAIEWSEADAKLALSKDKNDAKQGAILEDDAPELQIKITNAEYKKTDATDSEYVVTLEMDGARFLGVKGLANTYVIEDGMAQLVSIKEDGEKEYEFGSDGDVFTAKDKVRTVKLEVTELNLDKDDETTEIEYTFTGMFAEDDVISFDLAALLDDIDAGTEATVSVDSDDFGLSVDGLVFASILDSGIKASVKKVAEVAEEEITPLEKDLKITSIVGDFEVGQLFELKLTKGFEFDTVNPGANYTVVAGSLDENEVTLEVTGVTDEIVVKAADMKIEAVSANAGDVCSLTVKAKDQVVSKKTVGFDATAEAVEVVKVIADAVVMSVDEDEDVPVMYSGVNVENKGITDDSDHVALEVTIEETTAGAWDFAKAWNLNLPDGVYVAYSGVKITSDENLVVNKGLADVQDVFRKAYIDGDNKNFEFGRRVLDQKNDKTEKVELSFELTLVADPGFVGPVALELDLNGETQEVVIAEFKTPLVVEAQQNDLKIDYRNTEVGSDIVVKETEAGLLAKDSWYEFEIGDLFDNSNCDWEEDIEYTVNEDASEMEIDGKDDKVWFEIDETSDEEAAVITISNLSLFMERNIPAGAYDLTMSSEATDAYMAQKVFAPSCYYKASHSHDDDCIRIVKNVTDADGVVKEGFINVVTAGREQDDASFTTKVVVPVGESYIYAGEATIALDVPAYVSEAGYTMLPVRAVATALGINNNNVLWDQATKTVTILYGQRIITMTVGSKVINVNGSAIPASASVEVVDGRTFLPMRDLATALGVTDITWAPETKTATLNGNV